MLKLFLKPGVDRNHRVFDVELNNSIGSKWPLAVQTMTCPRKRTELAEYMANIGIWDLQGQGNNLEKFQKEELI